MRNLDSSILNPGDLVEAARNIGPGRFFITAIYNMEKPIGVYRHDSKFLICRCFYRWCNILQQDVSYLELVDPMGKVIHVRTDKFRKAKVVE
jgi:hypothetical protein